MRVALLTADYPPYSSGGVGSLSYELARGLSRAGVDVIVVTRGVGVTRIVERDGVRVYYLASPPVPPKDVWYYVLRMGGVRRVLAEERPEVIHDVSSFAAFHPWITGMAPTVVSVQGSPMLDAIRRALGAGDALRSILFELSHKLPSALVGLIKRPEIGVLVFVSRFVMLDTLARIRNGALRERLARKSLVVYNGVDVERLRAIKDRVVRDEGVEERSVVFMGRLMKYKGVTFLIKAFRHVVSELRGAVLHIVGDGPLSGVVRRLPSRLGIERNVVIHGALPRSGAMRVLARSALLTHPSLYESFGMVIAEAYAMGKPVVTHKAGYARELVEEPGAGLTVNVMDSRKYAEALIALLTDRNLYRRLSQNASKFAEESLSVSAMVRGYVSAYARAVRRA